MMRVGFSLATFFHNVYALFTRDYRMLLQQNEILISRVNKLERENKQLLSLLCNKWNQETNGAFNEEYEYIKKHGISVFPYEKNKTIEHVEGGFDMKFGLPYVIHNNKKLFFPKTMSIYDCMNAYRSYIEDENLLGGGYREKAPHQYQTERFKINDGDIIVDVGCAEALLTLDVIEKVKHAYIFEADKKWIDALNATFNPYKEKVTIINKYVSNTDNDTCVSLPTALIDVDKDEALFIKMDIEGAEIDVLNSSIEFLAKRKNTKIACCTYHRVTDASNVECILSNIGYTCEYSSGVMLFIYDNITCPIDFRKGLIRAFN